MWKPGDLAMVKWDSPTMLSKINQIGTKLTMEEMGSAAIPQHAVVLIIAAMGEGRAEECFVLGPEVMGWTFGDRLEHPRSIWEGV